VISLGEYLRDKARPFSWGKDDCCTFGCDWVNLRVGKDPMASWRGTYTTRREVQERIQREGGIFLVVERAMALCGLPRASERVLGDVALVEMDPEPVMAIAVDRKAFAARTMTGIIVSDFKPLLSWEVRP
jgi:hypothetical protein